MKKNIQSCIVQILYLKKWKNQPFVECSNARFFLGKIYAYCISVKWVFVLFFSIEHLYDIDTKVLLFWIHKADENFVSKFKIRIRIQTNLFQKCMSSLPCSRKWNMEFRTVTICLLISEILRPKTNLRHNINML